MVGETIGMNGEQLTGQEMAAALSGILNQQVLYNKVTPETFGSFGFLGADNLNNMFQFYHGFEEDVNRVRDVQRTKELNPELKSFNNWLTENTQRIPLE